MRYYVITEHCCLHCLLPLQVIKEFLESKSSRERTLAAFQAIILTRVIVLPDGPPKRLPLTAPKRQRKKSKPARRSARGEWSAAADDEDDEVAERKRKLLAEAEARAKAAPSDEVELTARGVSLLMRELRESNDAALLVLSASLTASVVRSRDGIAESLLALDVLPVLIEYVLEHADVLVRRAAAVALANLSYNPQVHNILVRLCRDRPGLYDAITEHVRDSFGNQLARPAQRFIDEFIYWRSLGLPVECLEANGGPLISTGRRPTHSAASRKPAPDGATEQVDERETPSAYAPSALSIGRPHTSAASASGMPPTERAPRSQRSLVSRAKSAPADRWRPHPLHIYPVINLDLNMGTGQSRPGTSMSTTSPASEAQRSATATPDRSSQLAGRLHSPQRLASPNDAALVRATPASMAGGSGGTSVSRPATSGAESLAGSDGRPTPNAASALLPENESALGNKLLSFRATMRAATTLS